VPLLLNDALSSQLSKYEYFGLFASKGHYRQFGRSIFLERQRYDDTSGFLRFSGQWTKGRSSLLDHHFKDTYSYTTDISKGKLSFDFYGTKLRYIGQTYSNKAKIMRIKVDGIEETFTQRGVDTYLTINYEKLNLPLGYHKVEVSFDDSMLMVDAIDIDEQGYLVDVNTPINLTANAGDSQATLKWDAVKGAESYIVKYGTESGVYTQTVTATKDAYGNYVIPGLTNGTTYYFVVSATVNGVESDYSNEASATPQAPVQPDPEPSGDRAILTIYLTNGTEKEYDLSQAKVAAFIDWYDSKDAGVGPAKYAFNKTWNKGPFSKRTEYVIFDKILTFNIDEYSAKE
jgi:hypothetical protein